MSITDDMVAQRNLQLQDESPTLQKFAADQHADIETRREIAGNEMQNSDWFNGPVKGLDEPEEKDVELTTSDDFLPYLADIQNDFDFVQQYTDDKKKGRPRQEGEYSFEYLKPDTRTVQGVDLATGTRKLNTADFNVDGVEHHVGIGVGLLRKSTNSAINGPNDSGVRGMSHIARSIQLEGGDFNSYKNALDQVHVSDPAMLLGWNAAARAKGQQEIQDYLEAPTNEEDVAELPPTGRQDINTEDLINEPDWVDNARFLWNIENAGRFEGSDQELVDWGLNEMSNFNWRILGAKGLNGTSMAYYATQAGVQGADYAKSLLTLIEMYDRVNTDWGVVGRSVGALATDPLTYAGLGAGRIGAGIAAQVTKNRLKKFLIQSSTIGAVEGAAFSGGENLARQSVKVSAGEQESINLSEAGLHTGAGLVIGGALGPVVGSLLSPYAVKHYRAAGRKMLDNARATGGPSRLSSQTGAIGDLAGFVPMSGKADRISTRRPTAVSATEDSMADNLVIGIDAMESDGASFAKNINFVKEYDNYRPSEKAKTDKQVATRFKKHIVDNLLWLHDQMDPEIRAHASQWYNGARKQTEIWSKQYGLKDRQVAAVIAALSPQKDWFMNMSLAERMMDVWTGHQGTAMDSGMVARGDAMFSASGKTPAAKANREIYNKIQGKTLAEMETNMERAMWIRIYDETHNPRHHKIIHPDGSMHDYATKKDGNRKGTGWGSLAEIGKGVSVMVDGSLDNISNQMGGQHKVRNFYSNIIAPMSDKGEVTIDTHAVAAALLKPLSGKGYEVDQNFASSSLKGRAGGASSAVTGAKGTYGIYADAYRDAAAQRGILPREMQSIVWEEVRTLFGDTWKTKANVDAVAEVWKDYKRGKISQLKAQEKIYELAGGTSNPAWVGRSGGSNEGVRGSTYKEKLSGDGVPRAGRGDDG